MEQKAGVGGGTAMAEGRGRRRGEGTSCVHFKEVFLFFSFCEDEAKVFMDVHYGRRRSFAAAERKHDEDSL